MTNLSFEIAVCDDDGRDLAENIRMADEILTAEHICGKITGFRSAREFLAALLGGAQFQMLLLDVMMPEQDGMELARTLRQKLSNIPIVFASSNRKMALAGYEVSAVRYLAKPVQKESLQEAILYCHNQLLKRKNSKTAGIAICVAEEIRPLS